MFFSSLRSVVFLAVLGAIVPVSAQKLPDINQFDARIAYFEGLGQRDSFLFYANEKARLARQTDALALWGWIQVEIHDLWSDAPETALKYLDNALKQQWREPKDSAESRPFLYIQAYRGYYLSETGRIWQAVQAYEAARHWLERFPGPDPEFEPVEMLYKPLGNHYTRLGDNEKALVLFQKALRETAVAQSNERAGLYNNIGIAQWNQGDLAAAEASYLQGLALPRLSGQKRALLLTGLAQTELDRQRYTRACAHAEQAIRLLPSGLSSHPDIAAFQANALFVSGLAHLHKGDYALAGTILETARKQAGTAFGMHSRESGKMEIALAQWYRTQGKLTQALQAANRALSAVLPGFQANNPETNPDPALFYFENTIYEALAEKAVVAEAFYYRDGALHWLELALDCHEKAWQAETLLRQVFQYQSSKLGLQSDSRSREEKAMGVARLLYEKTRQQRYLDTGFSIAERNKAALLLDALGENLVWQRLAGSDPRIKELTNWRQGAAYFERKLLLDQGNEQAPQWRTERDILLAKIKALEEAIYRDYPALASLGGGKMPGKSSSFKIEIHAGEILTEYFVRTKTIDIFLLSGHQVSAWHQVANDTALQMKVRQFLAYFENAGAILADPQGYLQCACALGQKILPAETAKADRLTIVPDGFLNFIPFEALATDLSGATSSLRNAAYLIRRQEIGYAWSLATLRHQGALYSTVKGFLLGVAPLFEHRQRGLAPLRGGKSEWNTLPARNAHSLTGADANMAGFRVQSGQYRILHLNTHAFAGLDDSLPPRIELYDSTLWLPDIYALPLHADLVVLSACQTGLGAEQKGEGVMSLARAFAQSGAACILSSLWTVNDRSSTQLFQDFYRELGAGQPVTAALRQAKLNYLQNTAVTAAAQSPYFWAGVVAVGASREITAVPQFPGRLFLLLGAVVILGWLLWQKYKRKKREVLI